MRSAAAGGAGGLPQYYEVRGVVLRFCRDSLNLRLVRLASDFKVTC